MTYKYMGLGNIETEMRASTIIGECLNNAVWRDENIKIETKRRVYKAIVRPTMTYTAEVNQSRQELNNF